jgi:hypothetical protein
MDNRFHGIPEEDQGSCSGGDGRTRVPSLLRRYQEKVEALQKRLIGRIEEENQVLSVNLAEIAKKQRDSWSNEDLCPRGFAEEHARGESRGSQGGGRTRRGTGQGAQGAGYKYLQIKKLGDESRANSPVPREEERIEEMEGD